MTSCMNRNKIRKCGFTRHTRITVSKRKAGDSFLTSSCDCGEGRCWFGQAISRTVIVEGFRGFDAFERKASRSWCLSPSVGKEMEITQGSKRPGTNGRCPKGFMGQAPEERGMISSVIGENESALDSARTSEAPKWATVWSRLCRIDGRKMKVFTLVQERSPTHTNGSTKL